MSPHGGMSKERIVLLALLLLGLGRGEAAARRERPSAAAAAAQLQRAAAQGRLREGLTALAARDLAAAGQKLSEAYLEAPSLEVLYALAQLALAEGKTLQAQDLMRRFLADPLLESTPDSAEYREAERVLALPPPPGARLDIQGTRGTIIKLDGRPVGVLPLAGPIVAAPGEHRVEILAGDRTLNEKVLLRADRFSELRYNLSTRACIINVLPGALILVEAAGLAAAEQRRLREALESAVQKERYSPLGALAEDQRSCQAQDSCLLKEARKLATEYIVTARAESQGKDWKLTLELFDVEVGASAAAKQSSCAGCSGEQVAEKLAALFSPLLKQAVERPRGRAHLVSDPSGAEVTIDGQPAGVTPYEGPLFAGPHKLRYTRKRFHSENAEVLVKENQTAESHVILRDLPDPPPPLPCPAAPRCPACPKPGPVAPRLPLWRLLAGIAGISAGVAMVGFGTPAIALDGFCADASPVPGRQCLNQFATQPLGAALTGVGAALTITGTVLLLFPPQKSSRSQHR